MIIGLYRYYIVFSLLLQNGYSMRSVTIRCSAKALFYYFAARCTYY